MMVYDTIRRLVVVHFPLHGVSGEQTWELDGLDWRLAEENGVLPASDSSVCFDTHRGVLVRYGGFDKGGVSPLVWEWDGSNWTLAGSGPYAVVDHAMAYDSLRQVSVAFGGEGEQELFDYTIEYDGIDWTFRAFGPPPARAGHAMTYDSWRHQTLMYGGGADQWDLWAWDGQTWTLLDDSLGLPGVPKNRSGHTMVFDSRRGVTMLFGGSTKGHVSNDLWEWDGVAWGQVDTPIAPSPRADHAMCYDPDHHRLVLFGGRDDDGNWLNDTWEYILPEPPCYPDLDGNGALDLFDFLSFTNLFNAGGDSADCDASGVLDLFDFLCFTNAFNAGC